MLHVKNLALQDPENWKRKLEFGNKTDLFMKKMLKELTHIKKCIFL